MGITIRGDQIVADLIQAVSARPGLNMSSSHISKNVFEVAGLMSSLLYVKARSQSPWRWGVTANVVNRLKTQTRPWAVVLLMGSHDVGYLLSSGDVNYYTGNVWPLGADRDFKPATGSYLRRNSPFSTMEEFCNQLEIII
jgi:hypothetical protein